MDLDIDEILLPVTQILIQKYRDKECEDKEGKLFPSWLCDSEFGGLSLVKYLLAALVLSQSPAAGTHCLLSELFWETPGGYSSCAITEQVYDSLFVPVKHNLLTK